MLLRIDIESPLGTKIGSGPIMSATDWRISYRLDRAGEFSFTMPLADPLYPLLAGRPYVKAWTYKPGLGMDVLGIGIVDHRVETGDSNPSMATISGSNLMRELTWRSVRGLLIAEPGYVAPEDIHALDATAGSAGPPVVEAGTEASPNNYTLLPNLVDGNAGTWSNISTTSPWRFFYVGYSRPFSEVKFVLHTVNSTVPASITRVQYFTSEAGWVDFTFADNNFVDGTFTTLSMGQSGSFTFDIPANWVPMAQNARDNSGSDPDNNFNDYWIRFFVDPGTYQTVEIAEVTVLTDVPTLTGPTLIMALAPAGWGLARAIDPLAGYATTATPVYLQLGDETVLDALGVLAGITGEHFRLYGAGDNRNLEWTQTDSTDSGIVAMRNGDPALVAANPAACLISELRTTHDSLDMVSRVIPFGSGHGAARTTLAYTTRTAPAGYTLDAANNYLKRDATEVTYGQTERVQVWPNIGPASAATADLEPAANALFDAALYWLSTHSEVVDTYDLKVYALQAATKPGDTLRVIWLEIVDGVVIRNVDANLIILEYAAAVDQDGTLAVSYLVSSLARWPLSEADVIAKLMGSQRAMGAITQSVPVAAISSPNAAISVTKTSPGHGGLRYG